MVKSRFSLATFIGPLIISALIFLGIYASRPRVENDPLAPAAILVAIFVGLSIFFLRKLLFIRIGPDRLTFRGLFMNRTFTKKQLQHIQLWDANKLVVTGPMARTYTFPVSFYRNMPEMKCFLRDNYGEIVRSPFSADPIPSHRPPAETMEPQVFGGNIFSSVAGIILAIAYIVAIYSLFSFRDRSNYPSALSLVLIFFALFYTAVAGAQLFYFQLDGDRLVVRNQIFRWYQKQYSLEEIGNVSFQRRYRGSNVLRILTKDFKSRTFGAATLWDKHWKELREALEAWNIPVIRDTTI